MSFDWFVGKNRLEKPLVDFEEGLKRTIDWYRENESWWKPLKVKNKDYFDKQSKGNK